MKKITAILYTLLSVSTLLAQGNRPGRYISFGINSRITDTYVPNELLITYITKDFNPLTLTLSRAQFTNNQTTSKEPRWTNGTSVNLSETVNGYTGKLGYALFYSITPKTIKYATGNIAITNYDHQLNLYYTDPIYGKWLESHIIKQHNIGIELNYYIGRRFLDDLFCVNLNTTVGVKTSNKGGFDKYISNYPLMDKYYTPGFGFGLNAIYFNLSLGFAISI